MHLYVNMFLQVKPGLETAMLPPGHQTQQPPTTPILKNVGILMPGMVTILVFTTYFRKFTKDRCLKIKFRLDYEVYSQTFLEYDPCLFQQKQTNKQK